MSVATKDNITFYSSPDLKNWTKESDFGDGRGAHGGGWECPDLISLDDNGKQRWVLIVNLNPGAPNGDRAHNILLAILMVKHLHQIKQIPVGWIMDPIIMLELPGQIPVKEKY